MKQLDVETGEPRQVARGHPHMMQALDHGARIADRHRPDDRKRDMTDRIILLGTKGGPRLATGSSWPSSSVVEISGRPYIVDCGMGVTRQFVEAGYALADVHTIVLTHLHSDHCLELGPLLHTVWCSSPKRSIPVHGPPPLKRLVDGFFASMAYDIEMRMSDEKQQSPHDMFTPFEYAEGPVFRDDLVEVTALQVVHPPLTDTYALRFRSENSTVVFSGDTCYFPPLAEFASGADVLVHEVMHLEGTERMCARLKEIKPNLMAHMMAAHTFGDDVGRIASAAGVGHLVVQHFTPSDDPEVGPKEFEALVRRTWSGSLTIGSDLAVIPIPGGH